MASLYAAKQLSKLDNTIKVKVRAENIVIYDR